MVHVRLNEREPNPNPHVNFITPLPSADPAVQEDARQLLRALAAQVRPVMKAHGFAVNSLEEYEHNRVFAGRNWNNGEVVELVLRGLSGAFMPLSWLMSTFCHELAHIKHMNHGPAFQALWTGLRNEVRELQSKGYYGDGYWSSGSRLADSARVGGQSLDTNELPEYMCGGAQSRARPTSLRRRRARHQAGPSNHTGPQTAKRRKAGTRVTAQGSFKGSGKALNEDASDEEQKKAGTGFRKKAGSKRAREERALAAERRLQALQNQASTSTAQLPQDVSEDESSDTEVIPETDQERRQAMLDSLGDANLESLKTFRTDFSSDFVLPETSHSSTSTSRDPDPAEAAACDVQILPTASATAASGSVDSTSRRMGKRKHDLSRSLEDWLQPSEGDSPGTKKSVKRDVPYGALVQDEMKPRKSESLEMAGSGQRLGGNPSGAAPHTTDNARASRTPRKTGQAPSAAPDGEWTCLVCTL
ncbi:hypothetical protein IEO21_01133 [Rhodonia placenta]|uniref:WLM domain-containing protein n=1 Tax=Rhodonia placenta TaxID=104341 RepID=A0A8H7PAK9_9APHY|nr:hypothetical protein IEO21_01133 [Postia placenta]